MVAAGVRDYRAVRVPAHVEHVSLFAFDNSTKLKFYILVWEASSGNKDSGFSN